jgi:hypothetical protein
MMLRILTTPLQIGWICLFALWFFIVGIASAFPPAPYYILYGIVRDDVGQTISAAGAEVILLKDGLEVGRTPITSSQIEQNYLLRMRLDNDSSGTEFYTEKAIAARGQFSVVVLMNGLLFYPIEVSGTLIAGSGGERVQLDLTLGEDLDYDGLPDAWEGWQLYQAGGFPDGNGDWDLSLIDADGDFDQDGQSNRFEYIAGTFAGDAMEQFDLVIKEKLTDSVRFEFYAITGKVYSMESSPDMETWTRVPFSVAASATADNVYLAVDVGIVSASATPLSSNQEFYRLSVR